MSAESLPAQPAKRRVCFSWPVLIAVCCLGAVIALVLLAGLVVWFLQIGLKSTDAYEASLAAVRAAAAVRKDFGEPLTPGWWVTGSVSLVNDSGAADLQYPIAGPKAQGSVSVRGSKTNGVWTYAALAVRRDDGKTYDLLREPEAAGPKPGAGGGADAGAPSAEKLVAQPIPEFLKGKPAETTPERAPAPELPPPPAAVRLAPVEASAVQMESAFVNTLLMGQADKARAAASNSFLLDGGVELLKLFAELAAERGGGTFTPGKSARLADGSSAVVGQVVFGNGTKMKVTVLTREGKVEGFTPVP